MKISELDPTQVKVVTPSVLKIGDLDQSQIKPVEEKSGEFFSELGNIVKKRVGNVAEQFSNIGKQNAEGKGFAQSSPVFSKLPSWLQSGINYVAEGGGSILGQTAGAVYDTAIPLIKEVVKPVKAVVNAVSPGLTEQTVKQAKDIGSEALKSVADVPVTTIAPKTQGEVPKTLTIGDLFGEGAKAWSNFKETNPVAAQDVGNALNILFSIPGERAAAKGVEVAGKELAPVADVVGGGMTGAGKALQESAQKSISKDLADYAEKAVMPDKSVKKVAEDFVGRTTETGWGPFKRSIITPTKQEQSAIQAIIDTPGINPKSTYQRNYNVVKDAISTEAQGLKDTLKTNDFAYDPATLKQRLNGVKERLAENPNIVGDAEKTASKIIAKAEKLIDESPNTGSSILDVRKNLDKWVELQKGSKVFNPDKESAFSIALREIRGELNGFLDESAQAAGISKSIQDSLHTQSNLYRAMDALQPKAALEADTAIGRAFQRMGQAVGIKNKVVQQIAAIAGIGGLGAAATFAPFAAGLGITGFLAYKGGKLILNPQIRKYAGKLLEEAGKLLSPAQRAAMKEEMGIIETAIKSNDLTSERKLLEAPKYLEGQEFKGTNKPGIVVGGETPPATYEQAQAIARGDVVPVTNPLDRAQTLEKSLQKPVKTSTLEKTQTTETKQIKIPKNLRKGKEGFSNIKTLLGSGLALGALIETGTILFPILGLNDRKELFNSIKNGIENMDYSDYSQIDKYVNQIQSYPEGKEKQKLLQTLEDKSKESSSNAQYRASVMTQMLK